MPRSWSLRAPVGEASDQPSSEGHPVSTRWLVGSIVSLIVLCGTYSYAVLTSTGQAHENAALRGADQLSASDSAVASEALGAITVGSLAAAIGAVALIGLIRRQLDLVIAGAGVIVAGQVVTQSLKRFVLPRPALVEVSGHFSHNSYPSGHTTIAMTVLFACLLVIGYRWRGVAMLVVLPWATGIGAYTISAKWHRLSDVIGGGAVSMLVGCLASWWLTRRRRVDRYDGGPYYGRMLFFGLVAIVTALFLVLGLFLWFIPVFRGTEFAVPSSADDYTAFLGAHAMAAASSGIFALAFWSLWHDLQIPLRPDSRQKR